MARQEEEEGEAEDPGAHRNAERRNGCKYKYGNTSVSPWLRVGRTDGNPPNRPRFQGVNVPLPNTSFWSLPLRPVRRRGAERGWSKPGSPGLRREAPGSQRRGVRLSPGPCWIRALRALPGAATPASSTRGAQTPRSLSGPGRAASPAHYSRPLLPALATNFAQVFCAGAAAPLLARSPRSVRPPVRRAPRSLSPGFSGYSPAGAGVKVLVGGGLRKTRHHLNSQVCAGAAPAFRTAAAQRVASRPWPPLCRSGDSWRPCSGSGECLHLCPYAPGAGAGCACPAAGVCISLGMRRRWSPGLGEGGGTNAEPPPAPTPPGPGINRIPQPSPPPSSNMPPPTALHLRAGLG